MPTKRQRGKIKLFNETSGYGFIIPDDGGEDVFLHAQVCRRCGILPEGGMPVEFEAVPSRKGLRACWVGR